MTKRLLQSIVVMIAYIALSILARPWSPHYPTWFWYVYGALLAVALLWRAFNGREKPRIIKPLPTPAPDDPNPYCRAEGNYQREIDSAVELHDLRVRASKEQLTLDCEIAERKWKKKEEEIVNAARIEQDGA